MSEVLIEKEIIGYGADTSFSSTLASVPLKPRSVKIFVDYTTSVETVTDNGAGEFIGTSITGTVNYSTGEISINTSMLVPVGNQVYTSYTYFEQGVIELNKVQYVQQDFQSIVEGIKQFIVNNFPTEITDYQASSMAMSLIDINAWSSQNLAWYLNRKVTDLYFPTAITPNSVAKLARLLGYKPRGASSSIATVVLTLEEGPYTYPISIPPGFAFQGPNDLVFEYRGETNIVFLPGEVTKIIDLREGETVTETYVSDGATNQVFDLLQVEEDQYVEDGSIQIIIDGMEWEEADIIPFAQSEYFEADVISSPPTVKFGDGVQGLIPPQGSAIQISYVVCNGLNGRVAAQSIEDVVNPLVANFATIPLLISQPSASAGGDEPEDLRSITINAPKFQETQDRAITKKDYDYLVGTFPNVAKGDATVVRGVDSDITIQNFLTECDLLLSKLRQADRYLTPRPKIVSLTFGNDLFETCSVSVDVDGVTLTQAFDTDNNTTLEALAEQIADEPNIETAVVKSAEFGNVIAITGIADADIVVDNLTVTADSAPVITKVETSPAPNQVWQLSFDKDFFLGNVISLEYGGVPISIAWESSHVDMFERLATALGDFAEAPQGKWKEVNSAPAQEIELSFNKDLFLGCNVSINLTGIVDGEEQNVFVEIPFSSDHDTTMFDIANRILGLNFVKSSVFSPITNKLTVAADSAIFAFDGETLGYTNGTGLSYILSVSNSDLQVDSFNIFVGTEEFSYDAISENHEPISGNTYGATITVNHLTGEVDFSFTSAPPAGTILRITDYKYFLPYTIDFESIDVSINTVTYDTSARTIDIATDGDDTIALINESVTARNAPGLTDAVVQTLIEEDEGSVSSIADDIDAQKSSLMTYLDDNLNDGCRANIVQVSVLAKDQSRKYVSPPASLLSEIATYLEPRKDVTHSISTVSGFSYVIECDLTVEVQVSPDAIEDVVVQKIEDALKKSDSKPFGILVERDFNKSLYISEIYEALNEYLTEDEYNYLNVIIEAPTIHPTNLYELEVLDSGTGTAGQVIDTQINNIPLVPGQVQILVDGMVVATDNSSGEIIDNGGGFGVDGTINYANGAIDMTFTNPVIIGKPIQATYYKNLIDNRGNLICPKDHVIQYGTITVTRISRL